MQQRRGLKQDLPKPLRPGEIGFATDSRQIYIGADTTDSVSQTYNKTGAFEKTSSAQSTALSFANVQMVKFTVPHKMYDKGEFDGVTDTVTWTPASNVSAGTPSNVQYSKLGTVFSTTTNYKNVTTGNVFQSTDMTVVKNGVELLPHNTAGIPSGKDFYFAQSGDINSPTHAHQLTFRTPPAGSDEVSISYYGNSAIIDAISSTTFASGSVGFYEDQSISSHRQLSNSHIRVAPGSGVGFVGFQYKHIQVATDVKHTPVPVSTGVLTLGNIYFSKNDDNRQNVSMTANATAVTLTSNITTGTYSTSSNTYNAVYIEDATDWLNSKVLPVTYYDSANSILHASLPSNAASITRTISDAVSTGANLKLSVSSTADISTADQIYLIDAGNASLLNGQTANIASVDTANEAVTIVGFANVASNAASAASNGDITFMTLKNGVANVIVVDSEAHGLSANANTITTSVITGWNPANTATNVQTTGSVNSFILTASVSSVPAQGNANTLKFTPVVSNASITATPVLAYDLAGANSIATATATINSFGNWPKINNIAGQASNLYITHAEAVQKTPFDFRLHNDTVKTVEVLGMTPDSYSRSDSTVKAKFENWANSVQSNVDVNLFNEIYVNTEFNDSVGGHFSTWDPNINSSLNEMNFESRFEARDFSYILNSLYFESVNPDLRGLLNIKTNIEMLTTEALAAGTSTTNFTSPEQVILAANVAPVPVSELGLDLGDYDTVFIEYSIKDNNAGSSNNYRRVGTIMYSGDQEAGDVAFNDTYSELKDNVNGNITFTASVTGSTLTINSNNSLVLPAGNVGVDATMRYIVRRWSD